MNAKQRSYQRFRDALLAEYPFCSMCGIEHDQDKERLQYHHKIPQHTGDTDHSQGMLLCQGCHSRVSGFDRRQHKMINVDGYPMRDSNPYHWRKNSNERKRQNFRQLIDDWSC